MTRVAGERTSMQPSEGGMCGPPVGGLIVRFIACRDADEAIAGAG